MSTIAVNQITDANGGSTAVINGVTPNMFNVMGRNRIINGDMRIDQRNNGASVTPASGVDTYTLDRFSAYVSQASKLTVQRNAGSVTPPAGFSNYLGVTSSSAYSITASDWFTIGHRIEGFNCADLAWGTANAQSVTLSFWARSSLTGTFGGSFRNGAGNRSYPFTYTISAANTWEFKTITVAGDTSGTWASDNSTCITVFWGLGVGSSNSGTAGAWASASFGSATGAVSVVGTNAATFYITGVQLEPGPVATPFERVEYGEMLRRCMRYYQRYNDVAYTSIFGGIMYSSTLFLGPYQFVTPMRASPTLSYSALGDYAVIVPGSGVAPTVLTFDSVTSRNARVNAQVGSALTTGGAYIQAQNGSAWLALSAEL